MTNFKNQMKKRKITIAVGGILIALIISAVIFYMVSHNELRNGLESAEIFTENSEAADNTEIAGAEILQEKAVLVEEQQLEQPQPLEDDLRIHGFPYIKLTSQLSEGDYVDVRISFADGGDFILLSKKQIQSLAPLREEGADALWLLVSEEELLRLSSAVVDAYLNEDCSIYAIEYVSDTQKAAVVNYVVNDVVKQLMKNNPNIVKMAENVQEYSLWKEYGTGIQREAVYPKQEEIIYMD